MLEVYRSNNNRTFIHESYIDNNWFLFWLYIYALYSIFKIPILPIIPILPYLNQPSDMHWFWASHCIVGIVFRYGQSHGCQLKRSANYPQIHSPGGTVRVSVVQIIWKVIWKKKRLKNDSLKTNRTRSTMVLKGTEKAVITLTTSTLSSLRTQNQRLSLS